MIRTKSASGQSAASLQIILKVISTLFVFQFSAAVAEDTGPQPVVMSTDGVVLQTNILTPMHDGTLLASDIWLPKKAGKFPLILVRTPYMKNRADFAQRGVYFANHGFAFVVQDVRGRGESGGKINWLFQEDRDGFDTIEWFAKRDWSDGNVCMMGSSYSGGSQMLAAREVPPHLKCIAPTASATGSQLVHYEGGAFQMVYLPYFLTFGDRVQGATIAGTDIDATIDYRPKIDVRIAAGRTMPILRGMLDNEPPSKHWDRLRFSNDDFKKIRIPGLHITGWFDPTLSTTISNFVGLNGDKGESNDQYLVIGPWDHFQTALSNLQSDHMGNLTFGAPAIVDMDELNLKFFKSILDNNGASKPLPKVRIFVTGRNEWHDFVGWPVPGSVKTKFYMSSNPKSISEKGGGLLGSQGNLQEIDGDSSTDSYDYDPNNPTPGYCLKGRTGHYGADRSAIQKRSDVLYYSSPVLTNDIEVIGDVIVELFASSTARDTDFMAAITDVHPDGRAVALGSRIPAAIRARYRESGRNAVLLTPGSVEKYVIELGAIGHVFKKGHRIRVDISSSARGCFDVNPNTGNRIMTDNFPALPAKQAIYFTHEYPSALVLPVVSLVGKVE